MHVSARAVVKKFLPRLNLGPNGCMFEITVEIISVFFVQETKSYKELFKNLYGYFLFHSISCIITLLLLLLLLLYHDEKNSFVFQSCILWRCFVCLFVCLIGFFFFFVPKKMDKGM